MAQKSMPSWLSDAALFWSSWGLRIAVLSSVGAHVALVLLARTRRKQVSLWGTLLLWPAYQIADIAATYALGNLSLGGGATTSSSPPCEQQLVAFWAPFLLLHLGRPDNISAYALEDNTLSLRQALEIPLQALGASYVLYQYINLGNSGDLLPASWIMFFAGVAKYVERAVALWRGDLGNIRGSSQKQQQRSSKRVVSLTVRRVLDNEQALLLAHNLFHFCQRAMVDDSSIDEDDSPASERIFCLDRRSMCNVVEMELSLMYDILYTKAAVIHTWGGYVIRLLSPVATAAAATLFWLLPKECLKTADIIITCILLAVAFLLDVAWLVRALGSTWAYAFLNDRPRNWLHHALLCSGWWRWLRDIVVALDPSNLLCGKDPRSYRTWSGKIGRYNLLDQCTRTRGWSARLWSWVLAKIGLEELRYLFPLPQDVKNLLFQRIRQRLPTHDSPPGKLPGDPYSWVEITTLWGDVAVKRRPQVFQTDPHNERTPFFGREFQEDILVWHIGTSIFLACADQQLIRQGDRGKYSKAVEALSEYLMFLVAVRRHMLPGLVLSSLFEVTRDALVDIQGNENIYNKDKLAEILHEKKSDNKMLWWGRGDANKRLISDGAALAISLIEVGKSDMQEMLDFIFDVWVDKLLYTGTQCSRQSHAKQLSHGGELTTIVWIMTEHAGPFRVGQFADGIKFPPAPPREPEPPKKEEPRPPPPLPKPKPEPPKEEPYPPPPPPILLELPPEAKKPEDKKPEAEQMEPWYATLYPPR